jgi:hypothetical protein
VSLLRFVSLREFVFIRRGNAIHEITSMKKSPVSRGK